MMPLVLSRGAHVFMVLSIWNRPRVPSYDEIVGGDSEEEGEEKKVGVSEDEDALDRQEEFERKFNFRFEEPGGDQVRDVVMLV